MLAAMIKALHTVKSHSVFASTPCLQALVAKCFDFGFVHQGFVLISLGPSWTPTQLAVQVAIIELLSSRYHRLVVKL